MHVTSYQANKKTMVRRATAQQIPRRNARMCKTELRKLKVMFNSWRWHQQVGMESHRVLHVGLAEEGEQSSNLSTGAWGLKGVKWTEAWGVEDNEAHYPEKKRKPIYIKGLIGYFFFFQEMRFLILTFSSSFILFHALYTPSTCRKFWRQFSLLSYACMTWWDSITTHIFQDCQLLDSTVRRTSTGIQNQQKKEGAISRPILLNQNLQVIRYWKKILYA